MWHAHAAFVPVALGCRSWGGVGMTPPRVTKTVLGPVFFYFGGARDRQPQLAEFQAQGLPGDPK